MRSETSNDGHPRLPQGHLTARSGPHHRRTLVSSDRQWGAGQDWLVHIIITTIVWVNYAQGIKRVTINCGNKSSRHQRSCMNHLVAYIAWRADTTIHDDVIKRKHFPRYWHFVRGIHRSSVNSPHKGQWRGALVFSLICALNKRLSKQAWGWWFETPMCSGWRHCNVKWRLLAILVLKNKNNLQLECGTWYHHPRRLQCVLSRNLRIFKVATWHYRCRHNLKNNCIWDNLQCCLLVPRSPSKPAILTFDLQSRKV